MPTFIVLLIILLKELEGKTSATEIIVGNPILFFVTFTSSYFSSTFGITKFFKSGPCRIVPDEGKLGGYFECGFIFLYANITSSILAKVLLPLFYILYTGRSVVAEDAWLWIGLNVAPQFSYVSIQ